ncbi:MAG TPA: hypothetical protein VEA35_02730, partial [Ramlibacter sp.]|nr:hypothetical protein [Ramlibacter sp.]
MSEPLTDAWIDSVLRQFQESYGLSLLGHPDRLRAFARDWSSAQDAARRAKDGSPKGRDACGSGPQDRQPGPQDAPKTEGGAQEGVPAEVLTTCNCRWRGEKLVQQCTLHEAWKDAIHDWAGRAKAAEQRLQALATHPAPAQEAPKAPLGHDMRERIAEAHDASLDDDHTGCRAILKECLRLLDATPPAQEAPEPTEAEIDLCRELAGLPAKIALPSGAEYDIRPGIYRLVGHLMVRAKYAPAPQEAPQAETPAAWQSRVNLGGRWTEWKECAPRADDEPRELVSDGRVAYQF